MSYADLKPVKFDDPIVFDNAPHYHNDYFHPFVAELAEPELAPYSHFYPVDQSLPPQQEPQNYQYLPIGQHHHCHQAPSVPQTPENLRSISFRPSINATPQPRRLHPSIDSVDRESSKTPSDISEECRNHWMPMTWIERSSDDPQVFNFVCLWGQCVSVSSGKDEFVEHLYSHISALGSDIQRGIVDASEGVQCRVRGCGKKMETMTDLNRHMSMHVFQADCQQKGSEALIEKAEYTEIESCGFEPTTNINYEGEMLVCLWENCQQPFTSLTDLFDHVGQHIDDVSDIDRIEQDFQNGDRKNVFPCKWTGCTTMVDSKSNLRRHARHHSGEKVLACPFCARFFSRRDKLYDHCVRRTILMKNDMNDPFLCKLCQKRFGTEKALCMHVSRHLVAHVCPLCTLALSTRAEIHRHLMTKHSRRTKDFKCETCNKLFFSESELNRHAVFHSDIMYSCKHCDEKFKWKKQLLKHMKEHDENFNPSPYTCHLCDRTYTTGFALGRHLTRQHRLEVPYGFSRFTYKKCADGLMRLQTKKLFRSGSGDEHSVPQHSHY
uniref:C2H2-type domain-containing protein n=1 Tax=Caenorhabditis japonica TaxID=281687 RepID=A0A8R1I6I9_CAEJA